MTVHCGSCRNLARVLVVFGVVHGAALGFAAAEDKATGAASSTSALTLAKQADPAAGLSFETPTHLAWYKVFWFGKCGALPFFERLVCLKGQPNWAEVSQTVLAKTPLKARAGIRDKMTELGRLIGYEWARHNDVRRIDNEDLKRWADALKNTSNTASAVERATEAARRRLKAGNRVSKMPRIPQYID